MLHVNESSRPPTLPWNLEGSIRDEYMRHDPRAMFPEPSSTIPNATMTQRRILEGVAAPVMLGLDSEAEMPRHMLPPEASAPFSDVLRLSPTDHVDHFLKSLDSGFTSTNPSSSECQPFRDNMHLLEASQERIANIIHEPEGDFLPVNADAGPNTVETIPLSPRCAEAATKNDAHSHDDPAEPIASMKLKKQPMGTAFSLEVDDSNTIDCQQESYISRPSRSRPLKKDQDQLVDGSTDPEKLKTTGKRRKATGGTPGTPELQSTPQKIEQICAMGFTPSTTERALSKNNGDVTSTIDWLITNGNDVDELAPRFTPKKSRKKTRQQAHVADPMSIQHIMNGLNEYRKEELLSDDGTAASGTKGPSELSHKVGDETNMREAETDSSSGLMNSPRVQVIIPSKSPKAENVQTSGPLSKKSKRKQAVLDDPETIMVVAESPALDTKPEKKRGRGRPKKTQKTEQSEADGPNTPNQGVRDDPQVKMVQNSELGKPATAVATSESTTKCVPQAQKEGTGQDTDTRTSIPASKITVEVASTTCAPERSTKTTSRSPKSKDRVPYRVGLSKRARIAPLLRTLKK